jgi:hypothetical protein
LCSRVIDKLNLNALLETIAKIIKPKETRAGRQKARLAAKVREKDVAATTALCIAGTGTVLNIIKNRQHGTVLHVIVRDGEVSAIALCCGAVTRLSAVCVCCRCALATGFRQVGGVVRCAPCTTTTFLREVLPLLVPITPRRKAQKARIKARERTQK